MGWTAEVAWRREREEIAEDEDEDETVEEMINREEEKRLGDYLMI